MLLSTLLSLALLAGAPAEPLPLSPIVCTPTTLFIPGQPATASLNTMEDAILRAEPGQTIIIERGDYPPLTLGFKKQRRTSGGKIGGQAGLPVVVECRGLVRIRGEQGDAIAITQDVPTGHIVFRGLEIHPGTRAGIMFYRQTPNRRHKGFHFEDCSIIGQYDHVTDSGHRAKWGVWGHQLDDFRFEGMSAPAVIQDIALEHGFYLQNPLGPIVIDNVHGRRLGRTFCQFTARAKDGPIGVGDITVSNCLVEDIGLSRRDGFKGGSAFTISGRLVGTLMFENNEFLCGFNPTLRSLKRRGTPFGTGAFVAWLEPSAQNTPNKLLVLRNNSFRFAEGCGDRPVVSIGGCRDVRIVGNNRFESGGINPAVAFDPVDELGRLVSDSNTSVFMAPQTKLKGHVTVRGNTANDRVWRVLHGHQ